MNSKCIILANGKPPSKRIIKLLKKKTYNTLICADGGADSARKLGFTPDYIIGDLDSVSEKTLEFYKDNTKVIKITRQNDTDVEKCLKFAIQKKYTEAMLLGVTGDRLDHTFCNLGIVIKFYKKIKLKLIAENSILIPYSGKIEIDTEPGQTISLYGFNRRTKITTKGFKYPLKNEALPFGERESTSNEALGKKVELDIRDGIIFLITGLKESLL